MDPIDAVIANVKKAAEAHGVAALARKAGVSYTTVKSFADRGWSHKNLDTVRALNAAAADLLEATS